MFTDPERAYDVSSQVRLTKMPPTFAARLELAFTREDYETVFADPEQMSLFGGEIEEVRGV